MDLNNAEVFGCDVLQTHSRLRNMSQERDSTEAWRTGVAGRWKKPLCWRPSWIWSWDLRARACFQITPSPWCQRPWTPGQPCGPIPSTSLPVLLQWPLSRIPRGGRAKARMWWAPRGTLIPCGSWLTSQVQWIPWRTGLSKYENNYELKQ